MVRQTSRLLPWRAGDEVRQKVQGRGDLSGSRLRKGRKIEVAGLVQPQLVLKITAPELEVLLLLGIANQKVELVSEVPQPLFLLRVQHPFCGEQNFSGRCERLQRRVLSQVQVLKPQPFTRCRFFVLG